MIMAKVTLIPLTPDDREQFIRDNQEAFMGKTVRLVRYGNFVFLFFQAKFPLTMRTANDIISLALIRKAALERYRSGHNEAVLKTVCLHGHEGSNPSLSASFFNRSKCTLTT